ncbi:MAG: hypothetical protein GY865_07800 [candidate division Zixibacteria bacterium]|nr:hypothetical protein [candidate division Zixibacteria bacterium]
MVAYLNGEANWINYIIILIVFIGLIYTWWRLKLIKEEEKKRRLEFHKIILRSFRNETILGVEDLISFHKSHFGGNFLRVYQLTDIKESLENALLKISSSTSGHEIKELIPRLDDLRDLITKVDAVLKSEEFKVPFYGTPEEERKLLEDIFELTKTDRDIIRNKLSELADLITARDHTISVLGEEKGKAGTRATLGLIGTVIFGVATIIIAIIK